MKNEVEIGYATVAYNEDGTPSAAAFVPTMQVHIGKSELSDLTKVSANNTEEFLRNAETVFAVFFNKINEIELADRSEYHIHGEQVLCERWENGNVKLCRVRFVFKKI